MEGQSRTAEWLRFRFPRQKVEPYLCIADFFRPVESGEGDVAAFHIVTMGAAVSEATAALFSENRYQDYLFLHGLGVEMAEALAEYWHWRIRDEWGFAAEEPVAGRTLPQQPRRALLVGLSGGPIGGQLEGGRMLEATASARREQATGWQYQPEQTLRRSSATPPPKYFVALIGVDVPPFLSTASTRNEIDAPTRAVAPGSGH